MRRPWVSVCDVCGDLAEESYRGFNFCGDCWEWFRRMMQVVDWKANTEAVVKKMREKFMR